MNSYCAASRSGPVGTLKRVRRIAGSGQGLGTPLGTLRFQRREQSIKYLCALCPQLHLAKGKAGETALIKT